MKRLFVVMLIVILSVCAVSCGNKPGGATDNSVTPSPTIATKRDDGLSATPSATPIRTVTPTTELTPEPSVSVTPEPSGTPAPGLTGTPTPAPTLPPGTTATPTPPITYAPELREGSGDRWKVPQGGNSDGRIRIYLTEGMQFYEKYNAYFYDDNGKRLEKLDVEALSEELTEMLADDPMYEDILDSVTAVFAGAYLENPTKAMWNTLCDYYDAEEAKKQALITPTPTPVSVEPEPTGDPTPTTAPAWDRNTVPEEVLVIDEDGAFLMPPTLFRESTSLTVVSKVIVEVQPTIPPDGPFPGD